MSTTSWTSLLAGAARRALASIGASRSTPARRPRDPADPARPVPSGRSNPAPRPGASGTAAKREKPGRTAPGTTSPSSSAYPGDFDGAVQVRYAPALDGAPDPGEIVWTWVPYEDDPTQGKDRPVLLVGHDGTWLLGLMLSSKDHSHDAADEARWGRRWLDVGTGPWDAAGRPSQVRLDRVIRVDPEQVRREGAVMNRSLFDRVTRDLA